MLMDIISTWWPVVPTVMTVAGIIARITPNKTDDKLVAFIMKIVDAVTVHPKVTKLNKIQEK